MLFCLFLPESFWTRQDERTDGAQVVVNDLPQILRFLCVVLARLRDTARLWEKVGSWYAHSKLFAMSVMPLGLILIGSMCDVC